MSRILLISHVYPPAVDGGSRIIYKFGEYLKRQGHELMVLTSDARSSDDFVRKYQPITVQNPGIHRLPVCTLFHRPLKIFSKVLAKGPLFKIIPFLKFLGLIKNFHPDYIVAGPLPTVIVLYGWLSKKITGAKLLMNASFHPTDPEFRQPLLIKALKSADYIWTLTEFETEYLHHHFGIPETRMIPAGCGIDVSLLTKKIVPPQSKTNLLYIGSFAAHKNIPILLEAFSRLPADFHLILAGQSTLYSPLITQKINGLSKKIRARIRVLKSFADADLAKIIDSSAILISPSVQESFGLVLIEAMARGRPVIAADIPASAEIVRGSGAGVLFKPGDSHDLAQKILKLAATPKYRRYSQNGITFAAARTWDKIGLNLWQKLSSLSLS